MNTLNLYLGIRKHIRHL